LLHIFVLSNCKIISLLVAAANTVPTFFCLATIFADQYTVRKESSYGFGCGWRDFRNSLQTDEERICENNVQAHLSSMSLQKRPTETVIFVSLFVIDYV